MGEWFGGWVSTCRYTRISSSTLHPLPPFSLPPPCLRATYREMRTSIIDMVLATDMSQHFEHLTKFNTLLVSHMRVQPYLLCMHFQFEGCSVLHGS